MDGKSAPRLCKGESDSGVRPSEKRKAMTAFGHGFFKGWSWKAVMVFRCDKSGGLR